MKYEKNRTGKFTKFIEFVDSILTQETIRNILKDSFVANMEVRKGVC